MKKLLRTRDRVLTVLAFFGDVMIEGYVRSHGFGRKRSLFEALTVKNATLRRSVNSLLKTGEIERVIGKSGEVYIKLTSQGESKFKRYFPLSKLSSETWDRRWRIVIFDIEEKEKIKRNFLRRKLLSLSFGRLQESVYITPLDILVDLKEFLKEKGLFGEVLVFEARELFGFDPKTVANYVWKLEKLNRSYEEIVSEAGSPPSGKAQKVKLRERLFELFASDPMLPKDLLPDNWLGFRARELVFGNTVSKA